MALGTSLLALALGKFGYVANQPQNSIVLGIMKHSFTTIPGVMWLITGIVLLFYKLNKDTYNKIVHELNIKKVCTNE